MKMTDYIQMGEESLLHVYNRYPVVFERGEGVYLYDTDGRKYLDFAAGIAVNALGYGHPAYTQALKDQVDTLMHTSNLFYNIPAVKAAKKLAAASGLSKVFFTNSGAEAVEGAIKTARKYAWLKDHQNDHEIIAMNHSFHGRTMGALSVTGTQKYQEPFRPMIGGIRFADFNDFASVETLVNEKTCAIIVEPVQGEGGIYPADPAFLADLRRLCDAHDLLLIFDEIQCGMGRCGTMFAFQDYGVVPDVLTSAKALGCGVPVGAFVLGEKAAKASLQPGDHGTTYGGNPLACAAVSEVFDLYEEEHILENVRSTGAYLEQRLDSLVQEYDFLVQRRGRGLMQGLVVNGRPVGEIVNAALAQGLVVITAGADVLRFVPPLIITPAHVDEMIEKLTRSFSV